MLIRNRALTGLLVLVVTLTSLVGNSPAYAAPEAPGVPRNVVYTPITAESVTIDWSAVDGAEGYKIYRRNADVSTAELIGTVESVGYVDFAVEAGNDYWYSVSAFNSGGEGATSKEAFIVLPLDATVEVNRFEVFTTGSRLRLGDLDGDGRTDILVTNTSHQANYTLNGSVIYALVAYSIEGDILWSFSLDPGFRLRNDDDPWNYDAGSGVRNSSSDEPVNITDANGDGYNDVVAIMHPQKNRGSNYTGGVFLVLDGRTGQILRDASGSEARINIADLDIPGNTTTGGRPNVNRLGDQIIFANLDGRTTADGESLRQHVVIKARYDSVTALEMFDQDGDFTMDFVFQQTGRYAGQNQAESGHTVLAVDLDGDGIEELVSNYTVFKSYVNPDGDLAMDAWWWIKSQVEQRSGQPGDPKNDATPVYYPGTTQRVTNSDHVDTIQVGYLYDGGTGGDPGELVVVFGGAGPDGANSQASTFAYTWDGKFSWVSRTATEPQSLVLGRYRTDAPGLTTYGLDRRQRTSWPTGRDGLFLIGTNGEPLMIEPDNANGSWSSIVIRVDNWTGTYSPMAMAFNRNTEAIAAGQTTNPERIKPALYDGYFNKLFEMEDPSPETQYRFMAMDIMGDARTELVGYTDGYRQNNQALTPIEQFGVVSIFYNDSDRDASYDEDGNVTEESALAIMRSGITGEPRPMTNFMSNYSRYPTDWYFEKIESMPPSSPQVRPVSPISNQVSWTPVLTADSYSLYRNGKKVADFDEIGYLDNNVIPGTSYGYTVVAHKGGGSSPQSYPRTVTSEPDPVAPTITVKPESRGKDGVYSNVSFKLFDEYKVDKLTLNGVAKDLTDNQWSDLNGVVPGKFGAVAGENELTVHDIAGNATTLTFVLDVTGPTVTVKDGSDTVGNAEDGYEKISFKLFDEYKVDKLALNGVAKDLTDDNWSDLNGVKPGSFGAKLGVNELVVFDSAGNATTVSFTLVAPVPAWAATKVYNNGDTVSYNGKVYVAQWWTQNEKPGATATGSWMEQGVLVPEAGTGVRAWTPSWVYTGGETVAHNGHTWKAKWWTRNQKPGDPHGPWQDLGTY